MTKANESQIPAELRGFIQENINSEVYKFRIDFDKYYSDPTKPPPIDWDKTYQNQIDAAKADFERFQDIAGKRDEFTEPKQGDFVKMPDGTFFRISVWYGGDSFQAYYDGSIHIDKTGSTSFSGTCGELYKTKNLKPTTETKDGNCWIFSGYSSGGGRGINWHIPFKVWEYSL